MIRQLIKRLGLDRMEDYLSDEMRRVKIEVLQEERKVVQSLLDRIEERIASLGGGKRGARGAGKRRGAGRPKKHAMRSRKPGESLRDYVQKVLEKASGPLKVTDLIERVKGLGYKSIASPNSLLTSTYKVLANTAVYHRVKAGVYELKKKAATKPERE